jgi:hypothetical protein
MKIKSENVYETTGTVSMQGKETNSELAIDINHIIEKLK